MIKSLIRIWEPMKKGSVKTLLFNSVPIEIYIFYYFMQKLVLETKLCRHILIGSMKELNL